MINKYQSGFATILALIAVIAILAAIAIPNLLRYQAKSKSAVKRTFAINEAPIVMKALNQSFADLDILIQTSDEESGYIETAWSEYLSEEGHGILMKKWKERKKYTVELKRNISSDRISLMIEVEIQQKPPNSEWITKDMQNRMPEDLVKKFEANYLKFKMQKDTGA